jgi:hypothetical protein
VALPALDSPAFIDRSLRAIRATGLPCRDEVLAMGLITGLTGLVSGLLGAVLGVVSGLLRGVLALVLALVATVLLIVSGLLCATILLLPLGIPLGALALKLYGQAARLLTGSSALEQRVRRGEDALRAGSRRLRNRLFG